ncbi:MAG: type II toxin-antitoxin system PemK/MazF family toxin, partial [Acidimicrobiales bacterium]
TSQGRNYPTRVACSFQRVSGQIVLDQIRTVDKSRLVKRLGKVSKSAQQKVVRGLTEMFSA